MLPRYRSEKNLGPPVRNPPARSYKPAMTHFNDDQLPADLREVADWLRDHRPEASALELDRMKVEARARAARKASSFGTGQGKVRIMRSKVVTLMLVVGLMSTGSTAAVIAGHKDKHKNKGDASQTQYRPGKGCGDKNHVHEREHECKKPPR